MLILIGVTVGILCSLAVLILWNKAKKARFAKMREEVREKHRMQQLLVVEQLDKIVDLIHNMTLSSSETQQRINASLDVIREQDQDGSYSKMIDDVLDYAQVELSKRKN